MTEIAELVSIAFAAAIVSNPVLTWFLGICPFLGVSRRLDTAFGMGAAVTFVVTVAATLTFLVQRWVLAPAGLEVLQYVAFILVIAATVQLVELWIRRFQPDLHEAFGAFLPLITSNCMILGTCLLIWLRGHDTLPRAVVYAAASGVGFTLALVLMAGLREELEEADVPGPFQGAPITLIVAGILALAFMGFAGMGRA